jgi:hypothetical protein
MTLARPRVEQGDGRDISDQEGNRCEKWPDPILANEGIQGRVPDADEEVVVDEHQCTEEIGCSWRIVNVAPQSRLTAEATPAAECPSG